MMESKRPVPYSHCAYCGTPFAELGWPRRCRACGELTYRNPVPVAVVLLPVEGGLLVVRRGVEPARGALSLPGGFIEVAETWEAAAARELYEETQVAIDPASLRVNAVHSAPDGTLLIFALAPRWEDALPPFAPSYETLERLVLRAPEPLAFPLHTRVVADYFSGQRGLSDR